MKKNLIAIIALTAALAASTSAFADTVQISEEELNKPVSTYAPDAMPTPEIQGDIMVLNDVDNAGNAAGDAVKDVGDAAGDVVEGVGDAAADVAEGVSDAVGGNDANNNGK